MAIPPSSSVLLLELEDLKEHMISVQAEVGRCLASLTVQNQEVCEVLAKLETVTVIVRAEQTVNRKKRAEEDISFQDRSLERLVDYKDLASAESMESFCAFSEGELHLPIAGKHSDQSDMNYRRKVRNQTCNIATGLNEAGEGSEVVSENDEMIDKFGGKTILDGILLSTRPSLSKNCRKNVKDKKNLPEYFNDEATTSSNSAPMTSHSVSSFFLHHSKMSSPSNVTGGLTSSSLKMSTSSMVKMVKDICSKQGWEAAGSYSTIEGKEGCRVVHFYQLKVNGGVNDLMTRGVGLSKVKAARRAFKTMHNKLIGKEGETVNDICDDFLNFLDDEEPILKVEPNLSFEMPPSQPHLFHSKDSDALMLGVKEATYCIERVKKTLTVPDSSIGCFIGTQGNKINRITKQTGVHIIIGDLVKGSQDRLVDIWGDEEACIDEAVEMIKESLALKKNIIMMKDNLVKLTVSNNEAGAIIGSKGTTMHRIIEETCVNLTVEGLVMGKVERLVEVWGEKACVDEALEMIKEILALNMNIIKENLITLTVSHYDAGAIIGTKRTNINRIIEDTGVNITVEGMIKGNERLVELWGHKASVDEALKMVKNIIQR